MIWHELVCDRCCEAYGMGYSGRGRFDAQLRREGRQGGWVRQRATKEDTLRGRGKWVDLCPECKKED